MAKVEGFTEATFEFLEALSANNNREWFNAHKPTFKTKLEQPFAALLEDLSQRLSDARQPLSGGPSTMLRMNRDVRFSSDKSPYKTSLAGLLTPSGSKRELSGLCYVHLDASGGFCAAGYYNLSPKQLGPIRNAIIQRADQVDDVLKELRDAKRTLEMEDSLSAMPRRFAAHADHRHADVIRLKSLLVREALPKVAWTSGDVVDRVERLARDAMPILLFAEPG